MQNAATGALVASGFRVLARDAGLDETALVLAQLQGLRDQPRARARQLQASEQGVAFFRGRALFASRCKFCSELIDADEEFAFLIEPAAQQRPFAQQGFVRHFHGGGVAVAFDGEQARARQALQQRTRLGRQRLQIARDGAHIRLRD